MIEIIYVLIAIGFLLDDVDVNRGASELMLSIIVAIVWPIVLGIRISKLRKTHDRAK